MQLQQYSSDCYGRRVFNGYVPSLRELSDGFRAPSEHFVLLIAAATDSFAGPELVDCAETIIRQGASYVCCWGPDCPRFHDCFDEADLLVNGESSDERLVMTTWHDNEPLEEAVWFALNSAVPSPAYEPTTKSVVVLCVGDPSWSEQVSAYLFAGAPMLDQDAT